MAELSDRVFASIVTGQLLVVLALAGHAVAAPDSTLIGKPNVILVVGDDVSERHVQL